MRYGLNERLPKGEFVCEMCKKYSMRNYSYGWGTFEILPKTPMKKLIICEKCVIRESKFKTSKQIKEHYESPQ